MEELTFGGGRGGGKNLVEECTGEVFQVGGTNFWLVWGGGGRFPHSPTVGKTLIDNVINLENYLKSFTKAIAHWEKKSRKPKYKNLNTSRTKRGMK